MKPTPDELRERITGLEPGERPAMNMFLAFCLGAFLRVGYRRRRT